MRLGERILYAVARDRAVRTLVEKYGVDAKRAAAAVAAVSDGVVQARAVQVGAVFDGSVLRALVDWFRDNPETVQRLLQIILSIVLPLLGL